MPIGLSCPFKKSSNWSDRCEASSEKETPSYESSSAGSARNLMP